MLKLFFFFRFLCFFFLELTCAFQLALFLLFFPLFFLEKKRGKKRSSFRCKDTTKNFLFIRGKARVCHIYVCGGDD